MDLSRDQLCDAYRRMRMIRLFEEKLAELVTGGNLAGFLHLYAGEEAVAVGVCAHLSDSDVVCSTHRGHGHCIAKGVDVAGMMAELYGRSTGVCKGKGGSMHIADVDKGMLGANGIVDDYQAMRHMVNLETVRTYEGTHDIHTLILGEHITGHRAY